MQTTTVQGKGRIGREIHHSDSEFKSMAEVLRQGVFVHPRYDPPYDSPIETIFARSVDKYFHDDVKLEKQVHVKTIGGNYILDFLVTGNGRKIAFECDGKDFHDSEQDEWRDAMIMGTGNTDEIYRLRGKELVYRIEDCLYVVSKKTPEIFSKRGMINLETLASEVVKRAFARSDYLMSEPIFYIPSIDFMIEHRMDYDLDKQHWPVLLKRKINALRKVA